MAKEALRKLGQTPSPSIFSNLQVLEYFNRLGTVTRYWAHALRRLGNVVRHIDGKVGVADATLATLFAEGCLDWFFCRFSHGPGLHDLTSDRQPLRLSAADELRACMKSLEEFDGPSSCRSAGSNRDMLPNNPEIFNSAVFAAVLAEILLSRKEHERALHTLDQGLDRFPDDLRLRQLLGLYYKRVGNLEEALKWLDPLYARFHDDEETAGITAGVYKSCWQANRANRADLEKSHRAYHAAWKISGRKNGYLGINSAATALWLGQREEAGRLAQEVEELLRCRAASLPADLKASRQAFNYWDQVTLAEAQLLKGDRTAAERTYEDAFTQFANRAGDIAVTRQQMQEILNALELD